MLCTLTHTLFKRLQRSTHFGMLGNMMVRGQKYFGNIFNFKLEDFLCNVCKHYQYLNVLIFVSEMK